MNIVEKKISDIAPYEKNPRKNDDAVKYVQASIERFGFKVPIVIDADGIIVAGHTRYKAAKQLGMKTVPCIVADDLTPEQVKAFRLADNKVSEKAAWDFELLSEELDEIFNFDMSDFGFDAFDKEDEEKPVEREDLSDKVGEMYQIIIDCADESEQEQLYYKFTKEGLQCRTLIL